MVAVALGWLLFILGIQAGTVLLVFCCWVLQIDICLMSAGVDRE